MFSAEMMGAPRCAMIKKSGFSWPRPVGAQPELTDPVSYSYMRIDEASAIQDALARRPDLGQIRLRQADADVQIDQAKSRKKTRADARFNFTSSGWRLFGGGGLTNILLSLIGLQVSVPIREKPLRENL